MDIEARLDRIEAKMNRIEKRLVLSGDGLWSSAVIAVYADCHPATIKRMLIEHKDFPEPVKITTGSTHKRPLLRWLPSEVKNWFLQYEDE